MYSNIAEKYSRKVRRGKFGEFTIFEHLAEKFGKLIDQQKCQP